MGNTQLERIVATLSRTLRRILLAVIAGLYVVSIPWYREPAAPVAFWWGLPDWVAVALGCYVAIALLNRIGEAAPCTLRNAITASTIS